MGSFKKKGGFNSEKPRSRPFGARGGGSSRNSNRDGAFKREGRFGGSDRSFREPREGRSFSKNRRSGMDMFTITCDKCGKEAEVPFRPTSGKPVYCSDCFKKNDGVSHTSLRSGGSSPSSEELEKINRKLDRIIEALEIEDEE
jgi:CxxC-x17-CxxC domain-containing protein